MEVLGPLDPDSEDSFKFSMNSGIPPHPHSSPGGALGGSQMGGARADSSPPVSMGFFGVVTGLGYFRFVQ